MRLIAGTRNPAKLNAIRQGVAGWYPDAEVAGVDVPSGVAAQPWGDDETRQGARNRAVAALAAADADFGIGLEGGVVEVGGTVYACAWCAVAAPDGRVSFAGTARCPLPGAYVELLRQGLELGDASDRLFGRRNSKLQEGAIGLLTRGVIDRAGFYAPAVTLAFTAYAGEVPAR
jgi:inosine/xanthosine triphosphatase